MSTEICAPADQERLLAAAVAAYRVHPQVEAVFTAAQIAATPLPTAPPETWSLIQRARASYYPGRSGDFVVILKKDVTPIADTSHNYVATHGSAWDYDRRVPILFWRSGHGDRRTSTVPPTPSTSCRRWRARSALPVQPGSMDGHCLTEVAGAQCPTR